MNNLTPVQFTELYIAWERVQRTADTSPAAFAEKLRLEQVDKRVNYFLGGASWVENLGDAYGILEGDYDAKIEEWLDPEETPVPEPDPEPAPEPEPEPAPGETFTASFPHQIGGTA